MVVRMYIGGLPLDVREDELMARFSKIKGCTVKKIDMIMSGEKGAGFRDYVYVELEGESRDIEQNALEQYQKAYHNTKWKGKRLRVAEAKPDYMLQLQADWNSTQSHNDSSSSASHSMHLYSPTRQIQVKSIYKGTKISF